MQDDKEYDLWEAEERVNAAICRVRELKQDPFWNPKDSGKWISVLDNPPQPNHTVIAFAKGHILHVYIEDENRWVLLTTPEYIERGSEVDMKDITHWIPLPPPIFITK